MPDLAENTFQRKSSKKLKGNLNGGPNNVSPNELAGRIARKC